MEIIKPNNPTSNEEIKAKNRRMFKEDLDRGGILAKAFIFVKDNEPTYSTEVRQKLIEYYKYEFDKSTISRALKKMGELGLLNSVTSGELTMMPDQERTTYHRIAQAKFLKFLQHIPKQFWSQYNSLVFYWISNGDGLEYLEWCCRLLGFEVKK